MAMVRRKILITGASGFIGQELWRNLEDDSRNELVAFKGDLLKPAEIEQFFQIHGHFDQIIHLVGTFGDDLSQLYNLNVAALANLLPIALATGPTKMIFTSTGAVYGDADLAPLKETDQLSPNTLYGLSKKWAEEALEYFRLVNPDLSYVILRFPNVYGPGSTKGVIYNFTSNIAAHKPIVLYGDGEQSRNFLHVSDAVGAITAALEYSNTDVFNISTQKSYSLKAILELLKQTHDFEIVHQPANNNLKHLVLNPTKAREVLKFSPQFEDIQL